jgi:peptidyl-prolyl cis-trans isomerase A (cyclophilin A)
MRFLAAVVILAAGALGQTPTAPPRPAPGLYATIHTSMGDITAKLFEHEAPQTVQNFVGLALGTKEWTDPRTGEKVKRPLYSGTSFQRVIPGFMIQGGDPLDNNEGGPGYTFVDEIVPELKFDRPGRLAMANDDRPNTNGSQFFITETPQDRLDGMYTIFGQVVEGQELVGQIARVPRNARDKPLHPVRILNISIHRVSSGDPAIGKK